MKIRNTTKWSTASLRIIVSACLRARGVPSTGLEVNVVTSRRHVTGRARVGRWSFVQQKTFPACEYAKRFIFGNWMVVRLPNPSPQWSEETFQTFLRVLDHEVAHLQGLRHKDMSEALYLCTHEVPWADGLKLLEEITPPHDVLKEASVEAKLGHVRRMLAKAETRLKHAETIVKKWRRRASRLGVI
jgi:hypothetical protein